MKKAHNYRKQVFDINHNLQCSEVLTPNIYSEFTITKENNVFIIV